ncbi:hypothetical protein YC2023_037144 [Brassica napus]
MILIKESRRFHELFILNRGNLRLFDTKSFMKRLMVTRIHVHSNKSKKIPSDSFISLFIFLFCLRLQHKKSNHIQKEPVRPQSNHRVKEETPPPPPPPPPESRRKLSQIESANNCETLCNGLHIFKKANNPDSNRNHEGFTNFPDFKSELEHIGSFKEEVNKIVYTSDNYKNN